MSTDSNTGLSEYNGFCKDLRAGNILYNIDSTNLWGEYLLVVNVTALRINGIKTYTVFLTGLRKKEGKYVPYDLSISLTPDYARYIPFLKPVGYCKFSLHPAIEDVNVNVGLVTVYGNTDLHKFATKLSVRKPRTHKYDRDGKPVIRKPGNK